MLRVDLVQVKPEQFRLGFTLLDRSQAILFAEDAPDIFVLKLTLTRLSR